ncbi:MAG: type VI secretion system tube protein TssD [Chitinophagaceae bacterium]
MSFKAKLKVAGKEYNVLDVGYSLHQEVDPTGRPSSITRGGKISVTVESTGETDLFEWMCNNFERKEGSVVFIKRDSDATLKELKFKEGYLIDYDEEFHAVDNNPLKTAFTISAKEISLGSGTHTNEWV